jgi:tRNA-uridine 2-sulfurtransferase
MTVKEKNEKIVVAMSGGVDSSVAAGIMKERGFDAVGVSLQLWNYSNADSRFGTCCSLDDLADARRVAERVGIPYYILNMEKKFKEEVVDYFISEYMQARTPIPCTMCNQKLKFEELIHKAESFGVKRIATGHYASIVKHDSGRLLVRRGRDRFKDQSYFLFNLSQEQLARLEFPLGDMDKNEVRERARQLGLNVAEKAESHEVCFIPDNDYPRFIAKQLNGQALKTGEIVNSKGKVLGAHQGYPAFTIGQRKGLNLGGLKEPHFVTHIDPVQNRITVGPRNELAKSECMVGQVNWCLDFSGPIRAEVQIRYRHRGVSSTITPLDGSRAKVEFDEPEFSIAPGQSAVFYQDDCVVGGGWLE